MSPNTHRSQDSIVDPTPAMHSPIPSRSPLLLLLFLFAVRCSLFKVMLENNEQPLLKKGRPITTLAPAVLPPPELHAIHSPAMLIIRLDRTQYCFVGTLAANTLSSAPLTGWSLAATLLREPVHRGCYWLGEVVLERP